MALRSMLKTQQRVNVNAVAKAAGVSRTFIYSQPDLLSAIKKAATESSHRLARPARPSSEASLRSRLVAALDAIAELKAEKVILERRVEFLTAELTKQATKIGLRVG